MSTKNAAKELRERTLFARFCQAASVSVAAGSVESEGPPKPDLSFVVCGKRWYAELAEITDQNLARRHSESLQTGKITGGAFSQNQPLLSIVQSKSRAWYETEGHPIILVLYYDKQYPPPDEWEAIPRTIAESASAMVDSGAWSGVWVYDDWNERILWRHLKGSAMPIPKPGSVRSAVIVLWGSLGLGLVSVLVDNARLASIAAPLFTNLVLLLTFGILAGLILLLSARRNWARYAFVVLFLVGLIPGLPGLITELRTVPVLGAISGIQVAMQAYACVLLFSAEANGWYRSRQGSEADS